MAITRKIKNEAEKSVSFIAKISSTIKNSLIDDIYYFIDNNVVYSKSNYVNHITRLEILAPEKTFPLLSKSFSIAINYEEFNKFQKENKDLEPEYGIDENGILSFKSLSYIEYNSTDIESVPVKLDDIKKSITDIEIKDYVTYVFEEHHVNDIASNYANQIVCTSDGNMIINDRNYKYKTGDIMFKIPLKETCGKITAGSIMRVYDLNEYTKVICVINEDKNLKCSSFIKTLFIKF